MFAWRMREVSALWTLYLLDPIRPIAPMARKRVTIPFVLAVLAALVGGSVFFFTELSQPEPGSPVPMREARATSRSATGGRARYVTETDG